MNTNATAQMVTSGGAGCGKQQPKPMKTTDQIATKLGHELWGQRNKLGVEQFIKRIKAAIEKATLDLEVHLENGRQIHNAACDRIIQQEKEIIELKTARQLASRAAHRVEKDAAHASAEKKLPPDWNKGSRGGSQKPLSGSKEIRQSRDASEGGESPTRCGLENRHEESPPAQRSPQFQSFLDSLEPQPWKRKKLNPNWATCHFNPK